MCRLIVTHYIQIGCEVIRQTSEELTRLVPQAIGSQQRSEKAQRGKSKQRGWTDKGGSPNRGGGADEARPPGDRESRERERERERDIDI